MMIKVQVESCFAIVKNRVCGCRNSLKAFSLIEVTVALAIFALSITVIVQTFLNTMLSLDSIEQSVDFEQDIRFVRSLVIAIEDLEVLEDGDEVSTLLRGDALWDVEIEETDIPDLFRMELEIEFSGSDAKEPYRYEETLYLLRPTWSDPIEKNMLIDDVEERIEDERRGLDWDL